MKPLFVPLKAEYFNAFKRGDKVIEYRKYGSRWNLDTCSHGRAVVLSKGYGKYERLSAEIHAVRILDNEVGTSIYPAGTAIIAIHLTNIQEIKTS